MGVAIGVIVLIIIGSIAVFLGVRLCVFIADIFGIDHANIPRKTFAANGLTIGFLITLPLALFGHILLFVITGLVLGTGFMLGIFFIEVAITKATRPLSDKVDSYIAGLGNNNTENASVELQSNQWRCPKCKRINAKYVTTCSCGCSLEAAERINTVNKNEQVMASIAEGDYEEAKRLYMFDEEQLDGNQWRCPKCSKINPKYVTTCACGCPKEEADTLMAELKKKKLEELERLKQQALEEKVKKEAEEAKIKEEFQQAIGQYELSKMEELVVRLLDKNPNSTLPEMASKLPRSVNVAEFKNAVNNLENMKAIVRDENNRFSNAFAGINADM